MDLSNPETQMKHKHVAKNLALGLLVTITGAASATPYIRNLDVKENGRGTLLYEARRRPADLERLQVRLFSDGTMMIRPLSGPDVEFKGRWWNDGRDRARIRIERVGRERANGDGYVELDGRSSFDRVSLSGRAGRDDFRLNFSTRDGRWDDRRDRWEDDRYNDPRTYTGPIDISRTHNNRGVMRYGGHAVELNRAHVKVHRNGTFEITYWGDRSESLSGTWTNERGRLKLNVDRGFGNRPCEGSGWMDVDARNGDWVQFSLSGRYGRDAYEVSFGSQRR